MVKNVRALIDEEKFDEAADVILQTIATIINTHSVMISVTKKDLIAVGPALISLLSGPSEEGSDSEGSSEPEGTDAPGDDIEIGPSMGTLTINFVGPEDDYELRLPDSITRNYLIGQRYKFTPHKFKGYTVAPEKATGVMTAEGITVEFVYTKDGAEESSETPPDSSSDIDDGTT